MVGKFKSRGSSPWLRLVVPIALLAVWLGISAIGGPYFGRISEVSSNDLSTFLPKNVESTNVKDEVAKFQNSSTIPAIVVFESSGGLTSADKSKLTTIQGALEKNSAVKGDVSKPIISADGASAFLLVPLSSNAEFDTDISSLQSTVKDSSPGMEYKFTGPAMFARDLNKAFAGIDGTLLFVALGVVFLILLIVYRSPILPIITLTSAIMALSAAIFVVWHLAQAGIIQLNGQVQGILFILVIGAATDYALLYIARYREELTRHKTAFEATMTAWKASWEPIVAAGGTVTLGLLCLLASDLGSNKTLGPVGGIGVILAVLTTLTFLPAALLLLGRVAFWPKRPKFLPERKISDYETDHPFWAKVGSFVGRHPRRLWIGITIGLVFFCLFIPQLKAAGVSQGDLIIGKSEARDGQVLLDKHFPGGSGSPAVVVVPVGQESSVVKLLEADKGIDTVSVVTNDKAKSPAPVGQLEATIKDGIRSQINKAYPGLPASEINVLVGKAYPFGGESPKVIDGDVVLQATMKDAASSIQARDTIQRLRDTIQPKYPGVTFGGIAAIQLDTNKSSERDLRVIIPLILVAITIVLMLLLRSIVAPLILLVTTVISFGTALGVSTLMFNHVWHFAGADPSVVIFGFVFLVALGIDYNIFLMTRVREETKRLGVRAGTLKALTVTGGVITSAGIVLASTFAALSVIPILFLVQIAFIVAFGVLLDTVIVRSLLVPSLTLEVGRAMWWPSKLWKKGKD
ncbi:MAG: MMPL family transporter [Candidatus Saccharimonas sp.]